MEPVTGEFIRSLKKWLVVGSSVMLANEIAIPCWHPYSAGSPPHRQPT
jgi:hypothetical protein